MSDAARDLTTAKDPVPCGWRFQEILIARHGETEWNMAGRLQGRLDSPLTEVGRQQAEAMAALVDRRRPDAVFSSPLARARQTAAIIVEHLGVREVTINPDLTEIDHGEMQGLTHAEIEDRWPGEMARRDARKFTWRFPSGESYADGHRRARSALEQVAATTSRRPMLVVHEMVGKVMVGVLLDHDPDRFLRTALPHGTVLVVSPAAGTVEELT